MFIVSESAPALSQYILQSVAMLANCSAAALLVTVALLLRVTVVELVTVAVTLTGIPSPMAYIVAVVGNPAVDGHVTVVLPEVVLQVAYTEFAVGIVV